MRVTVKDLASGSRVLAGRSGLKRVVTSAQMIAPDFSDDKADRKWTSSVIHVSPGEDEYLCSLPGPKRSKLVKTIMEQKPACIVVSGRTVCPELLQQADRYHIAVLKTTKLRQLNRMLVEILPLRASQHGVLVQVFGLGTLIIGKSAVGKSEAALDLLLRGHKLVADDVVVLERTDGEVSGGPVEMGSDLLQIRGLGILNVRSLYGESATTESSTIGLVVELEEWQTGHQYTLIGARERRYRLLGINLPYLKLPVKPGRNMAALVEVAVRNQMLKRQGIFVAREVSKRLKTRLTG